MRQFLRVLFTAFAMASFMGCNTSVPSNNESSKLSCGELLTCESGCRADEACGKSCYAQANESAKYDWISVMQCAEVNCTEFSSGTATYWSCVDTLCAAPQGCVVQGSAGSGSMSCSEGNECVQSCYADTGDDSAFASCVNSCYDTMNSVALSLMGELVACSNEQCAELLNSLSDYYQCQETACEEQYKGCMATSSGGVIPGGNPGGSNNGGSNNGGSNNGGSNNGGSNNGGSNNGGSNQKSCLDIHNSVVSVCAPAYSQCVSQCSDESCQQACVNTMDSCIQAQMDQGVPGAADDFQAVRDCRMNNYDTCNGEANDAYSQCMSGCAQGDTACQQACGNSANETYENCFSGPCASQYQTCGIEVNQGGSNNGGSNNGGGTMMYEHQTCSDVYNAVVNICSPAYGNCASSCSDDNCRAACQMTMEACIEEQKDKAPAQAGDDFQAVTDCRQQNYQSCYDGANTLYTDCVAMCSMGDTSCQNSCSQMANQSYESCFRTSCAAEYTTCGI